MLGEKYSKVFDLTSEMDFSSAFDTILEPELLTTTIVTESEGSFIVFIFMI